MFNELKIMKTNILSINMIMETTYSINTFAMRMVTAVVLLCVIGIGNVWGDTSTLTFTEACGGSGTADDGAEWEVTSDGTESTWDSGKGIHYGTSGAAVQYIQLSTSDITGTITRVVVNASTASSVTASVSVTVGGDEFGGDAQSLTASAADYTFDGSASGEIIVRIAKPSSATKAIYCKSVVVTYSTGGGGGGGGGGSTYTVTYNNNGGSGTITDNNTYTSGATVTVKSSSGFSVSGGFTFHHWNTEADNSGTSYDPDDTFEISANTTLYAQWVSSGFSLLTNLSNLAADDEVIIVNSAVTRALSTTQNASNRSESSDFITNLDGSISYLKSGSVQVLTIGVGGTADTWTFYATSPIANSTGYLYAASSSSNNMCTQETNNTNGEWAITIGGENVASIVAQGTNTRNVMQHNLTSPLFSCYGSANQDALKLYYRKARQLTFYRTKCYREFSPAGASGNWSTEANWTNNRLPNINDLAKINKPVTVDMEVPTAAKAKNVVIYNDGSTHTGQLIIDAGKELVVAETVRKTTDGSNYTATGENDIIFNSTSSAGLGALAIGSHAKVNSLNNATVNFSTLSNGSTTSQSAAEGSDAQYVGTPFSNKPAMLYQFYNSWMYKFVNSGTPGWIRLNGNEGLEAFKGYCVFSADGTNHTYWMQGTLVESETQVIGDDELYYSGIGNASNPNNENMLANSWMAPIKIAAFLASDFTDADATIYIYNTGSPTDYTANSGKSYASLAGQYATYTPGEAGTAIIPSMQAFSVYTSGGNPEITLNYKRLVYDPAEADEVTPGANKAPQRVGAETYDIEKMRLYVNAESGYGDMLYMHEREDFVEGFENGWDGRKLFGADVAPQLYAVTTDGNMAINCVPDWEGTVLGFKKGTEDNVYTFTFEYEGENTWYLNDLREQTSTLISSESRYMFMASDEDMAARFIISRTPIHSTPTGIEQSAISGQKSAVRKIVIDDHVYIIRNGKMYSAEGVMVR